MPKVKISEYSATANSNTDVASINIDEGCAPSGINNAIRAVMGHLKDFQQGTYGDPFNGPVNGTLGATTASTAVVTTLNSTDATDASSTTAAAMKTAGGLGVAKKMFVGLDANIYGLTVGRGAGAVATNTAVGASALAANTTGGSNTALGASTLQSNTTASNNTAVGYQAGYTNVTGTANTFIGYQAGYTSNATAANGYNTATGYQAGKALTTGIQNSFFGFGSGQLITSGGKNTILGAYDGNTGGLDIRTASNYIVLSDGDGNVRLYIDNGPTLVCPAAYSVTSANAANMVVLSSGSIVRSTSALKYKQDIRDIEEVDINLLRGVRYKSKSEQDDQTKDHFGIVADEVDAAGIKELVSYSADGEVEGFQYERLTVVLLKAMQTLKAEVDSLKAQINGASA